MTAFLAGVLATLIVLVSVRARRRLARLAPRRLTRTLAQRAHLAATMRRMYVSLDASFIAAFDDLGLTHGVIYRAPAARLPRRLRRIVRRRLRNLYLSDEHAEWPWAPILRDTTGKPPR